MKTANEFLKNEFGESYNQFNLTFETVERLLNDFSNLNNKELLNFKDSFTNLYCVDKEPNKLIIYDTIKKPELREKIQGYIKEITKLDYPDNMHIQADIENFYIDELEKVIDLFFKIN